MTARDDGPWRADEDDDTPSARLRVPPHSIEAEQSVLGGLLLDNQAWDRMGDLVTDTDFYRDEHRRIFRQIRNLLERAKPADVRFDQFADVDPSHPGRERVVDRKSVV